MIFLHLSTGDEVTVNEALIRYFFSDDNGRAIIVFDDVHRIEVRESADDVWTAIWREQSGDEE